MPRRWRWPPGDGFAPGSTRAWRWRRACATRPGPTSATPRHEHVAKAADLCFLQYTSGSTGQPRGVVLSHANVVATTKFMSEAAGLSAEDRVVSWLPLYHDMGLIGCAFTPPLTGTPIW